MLHFDTVPDRLAAVGPRDGLPIAIGKIDAIATVIETIDLTTVMLKKILHFVVLVIRCRLLTDRLLDLAGSGAQQ